MIIDFHTHIFPTKIAESAIEKLEKSGNEKAQTNGMIDGLLNSMAEASIDLSVILPIATDPKQFKSINRYALEINQTYTDKLLSFSSLHPMSHMWKEELKTISNLGFKGIKLHPDYQMLDVDDLQFMRVIDYACELGLVIVLHAGYETAFPETIRCTPKKALRMIETVSPKKLVLAHTGGMDLWDEVEQYLVGKEVYFDISYTLGRCEIKQFTRIVKNHGEDKILFATDSPWISQKATLHMFRACGFSPSQNNKILFENARRLLDVK